MEEQVIALKQQVEKLQRECIEKYSEIQALHEQNEKLRQRPLKSDRNSFGDLGEIIFQQDSSPISASVFNSPFKKTKISNKKLAIERQK